MTTVCNVKTTPCTVYIGRAMPGRFPPSKWGNSWRLLKQKGLWVVERRDLNVWTYASTHPTYKSAGLEVMSRYKVYVLNRRELVAALPELVGQVLGCWCKDEFGGGMCHGDVLVSILVERGLVKPDDLAAPAGEPQLDLRLECPSCGSNPDVDCACKRS